MWMDHQANSSAARKQMSWRALLPDIIQRHRQNDGLKNGLCEPRPVLQRAKASSDQLCLLTSADSKGERGREGVASVSERVREPAKVCAISVQKRSVVEESRTSGNVTIWFSIVTSMGGPPMRTYEFSARLHFGKTPYLQPHLTTLLTTPNVRCRFTFSESHPSDNTS